MARRQQAWKEERDRMMGVKPASSVCTRLWRLKARRSQKENRGKQLRTMCREKEKADRLMRQKRRASARSEGNAAAAVRNGKEGMERKASSGTRFAENGRRNVQSKSSSQSPVEKGAKAGGGGWCGSGKR
mmetsp:Transcript_17699/g.38384  ORF Transcript_17699/g.38384 Transcript_17699/m.38384 type:complete len:130 (+) Transcript_17699:138-527(+)